MQCCMNTCVLLSSARVLHQRRVDCDVCLVGRAQSDLVKLYGESVKLYGEFWKIFWFGGGRGWGERQCSASCCTLCIHTVLK